MTNYLHRVLVAAGLARIYEHLADGPFAILSAWKKELPPEENSRRDNQLRVSIHNLGLGFMPAKGVWREAPDSLQHEDSLFIIGVDRQTAVDLANRFQQRQVIWGDGGTYNFINAQTGADEGERGVVADRFHHLDPGEVPPQGKTEIKKKPFTFKDAAFEGVINADECYGGWALGNNQRWAPGFERQANWSKVGKPYFFWSEFKSKLPWPRFGFAIETAPEQQLDGERRGLGFDVYLPLGPESLVGKWRARRPIAKKSDPNRPLGRIAISEAWAQMVRAKGLGKRTGKETITDKAWITEDGRIEHHGPATTHQEFALRLLRDDSRFKSSGNTNRDQLAAEDILLRSGWIRVQVYAQDGLGLQGLPEAVSARGHLALQLLPKPRRIYIMLFPDNETTLYGGDQLSEAGLAPADTAGN